MCADLLDTVVPEPHPAALSSGRARRLLHDSRWTTGRDPRQLFGRARATAAVAELQLHVRAICEPGEAGEALIWAVRHSSTEDISGRETDRHERGDGFVDALKRHQLFGVVTPSLIGKALRAASALVCTSAAFAILGWSHQRPLRVIRLYYLQTWPDS